jgi:hypothetical protein
LYLAMFAGCSQPGFDSQRKNWQLLAYLLHAGCVSRVG